MVGKSKLFLIMLRIAVAVTVCDSLTIPMAQAAGPAWATAADPFQKFVHDILEFTKYLIARHDKNHEKEIAQSPGDLVKTMHYLATLKRGLASKITTFYHTNTDKNAYLDLSSETNNLDNAVRQLVETIRILDPNWVVKHNDLAKEIDKMEMEKASVVNDVLLGTNIGQLNRGDALKFAARLNILADQLDKAADHIAVTFKI